MQQRMQEEGIQPAGVTIRQWELPLMGQLHATDTGTGACLLNACRSLLYASMIDQVAGLASSACRCEPMPCRKLVFQLHKPSPCLAS